MLGIQDTRVQTSQLLRARKYPEKSGTAVDRFTKDH
jgi:hypothetical protein